MERVKHVKKILYTNLFIFLIIFYLVNPFPTIQFLMSDILSQHLTQPDPNIYVIGVDTKTLNALGRWGSWPRTYMAEMIRLLNKDPKHQPAAIGIDVMYFGQGEGDEELSRTAADYDNLIFASELDFPDHLQASQAMASKTSILHPESIQLPRSPLDKLSKHGFTNIFLDADGKIRRNMLSISLEDETYYNFNYEVYMKYAAKNNLPLFTPVTDKNNMWHIPYSVGPGVYGQNNSFIDILDGSKALPDLTDSIVLIGAYSSGMLDNYYTPVSYNIPMYGIETNANIIQALCENKALIPVPKWIQVIFLSAVFAACFYFNKKKTFIKNICFAATTLGYFLFVIISARIGFLWDGFYLPLFSTILFLNEIIFNYIEEHKQRMLTLETFERYVSTDVASHLLSHNNTSMHGIRESKRQIAVMFADIRGFTPLSENLAPEEVASILNECFTLTTTAVFENKGMIDKFIGDATMALFNAPDDLEDYTYKAVKTALEIREGSRKLQKVLLEKYGREVHFGIGVHCGEAVVGSIGTTFRMDYTAIGDTVNTAARLESIAAPDEILISKEIHELLGQRIQTTYLGEKQLKGKQYPVSVYSVTALSP